MSVIAISRGSLSAATRLAEGLGARLGSAIITREQVLDAAERYGIAGTGLELRHIMALHPPGFWENYADARKHYLACFKAALLDFVLKGPCIYHGNLAHVLLDDVPFVLRVRVNAPIENRVEALMADSGVSRYDAVRQIEAIDRDRKRWTEFLYDVDVMNPVHFDVVLNLSRMAIRDGVEMVAATAEKEQFRRTEESLKAVRDVRLATVAGTHLMHHPDTYGLDLGVTADSATGAVTVSGRFSSGDAKLFESQIRASLSDLQEIGHTEVHVKIG
jgi:cytidylate kinase